MPKGIPFADSDKKQRILQDLLDGMSIPAVAEKYGTSRNNIYGIRRAALGNKNKRIEDTRLARLEARVRTLETVVDMYFRERLKRTGLI
jgi:transposase